VRGDPRHGGSRRRGPLELTSAPALSVDRARAWAGGAIAFCLGAFHLLNVSGILLLPTVTVRIFHLMLVLALVFLGAFKPRAEVRLFPAFGGAFLAVASGAYLLVRWDAIAMSGGVTSGLDVLVGAILVLLVLEATRRALGNALTAITSLFLVYPFVSPYLPGVLNGRAMRVESLVSFLALSSEGVYGIPLGVAATYIVLFTIFGALLSEFNAGDFLFSLARSLTRGLRAASAKSAVLFSTLLGLISGSAAGNVAVTGSLTIPLMKREGYTARQAAAIEAVVSTGGQVMPPVMGAAAFIMADIIGRPYLDIMKAGLVPALLFFLSVLFVIHLQALRSGIAPSEPSSEQHLPPARAWLDGLRFLVPFLLLIAFMVAGYSPTKASLYAILALVVVQVAVTRTVSRELLGRLARALARGAKNVIPISMACAAAGIISAVLSVTGLASKLSMLVISLSAGVPLIALILTMLTALVLGMGLPTTAAYLMLATVVAPALVGMGVPLLTAHMFVFFYGCVSTITPPVALASYVAAGIAEADIGETGWTAFRYGLVCYVLPFAFFFGPALLAQGSAWEIGASFATGALGVFFLAAAIVGYLRRRLSWPGRAAACLVGLLLLSQGLLSDALAAAVVAAWLARGGRRAGRRASAD
jgi:TRAP transporter 4TM/12TM fusion protein